MPTREDYPDSRSYNEAFAREFRENNGRVTGPLSGRQTLILTTTGRRSGGAHITPLVYTEDAGTFIVSAAAGGSPRNPDWYHNLLQNPTATVELPDRKVSVVAHEAEGAERDRLHEARLSESPTYLENVKRTTRRIPLMVLEPTDPS